MLEAKWVFAWRCGLLGISFDLNQRCTEMAAREEYGHENPKLLSVRVRNNKINQLTNSITALPFWYS
jgi:hypothetical protein